MADVAGLLYNASGDVPCYNVTSLVGPAGPGATWLFQWCAQRAAQELPYFPATGRTDMFWYQGWAPLTVTLLAYHTAIDCTSHRVDSNCAALRCG